MIRKKLENKTMIFTNRELEVINKKLSGARLTQQDSNYLSKFVRPKLIEIESIKARDLLDKLSYNQKAISMEKRIINVILKKIKNVSSITIYGSVIQNNYKDYNDVDVLVITNKKYWKKLSEKYMIILKLKQKLKRYLNLDLQLYDLKNFNKSYQSNISLVYQLKDSKTIYGKLKLKKKIKIPKLDIRMKLDYSVVDDDDKGIEIYKAIRNVILINLILNKIIDNKMLIDSINNDVGSNLSKKLKSNKESIIERKIALLYLKKALKLALKKINKSKWEKIVLLNR